MAGCANVAERQESIDDLIVGNSLAISQLKQMIQRVARSNASVMITGPSGSGKEMVAQAIHSTSNRHDSDFVALNCGAIPAELMESELFGHEKGSFTGASARRIGRFEEAHKGTLFLDEIGDMRFDMQVKLLRVLEDGRISRIGSNGSVPVDVRIISATHQNIDRAITDNRFREDLYFRLGVIPIAVPSLAARTEDIPLLIEHFQKGRKKTHKASFNRDAMARLMQHGWPGNVRELRNIVERAGVLFGGEMIGRQHVEQLLELSPRTQLAEVSDQDSAENPGMIIPPAPPACGSDETEYSSDVLAHMPEDIDGPINLREVLESMELERIHAALSAADGVISEAARLLTLKRTTLIEKMRKYGVEKLC